MKLLFKIVSVCLLLAMTGCASTKLQLNLDIYKEDPLVSTPLSEAQIARIYQGLQSVEIQTRELTDSRIELAENIFNTYKSLWFVLSKAKSPTYTRENLNSELHVLQGYLKVYKVTVTKKAEEIMAMIKIARDSLIAYSEGALEKTTTMSQQAGGADQMAPVEVTQSEVLNNIRKANRAFIEIGGPLGTDFEKSLESNWETVSKMAEQANLEKMFVDGAPTQELSELRSTINKLTKDIEDLKDRGYRISMEISKELAEIEKAATVNMPGAMKKTVDAIAKVATAVPLEIGLGDRGATALNMLVQSTTLLYSQIDRLQDPADPVWRIVSNPINESKWNTAFTNTYFYAEGNSSVVVVRDSPISFRPQRGANNPSNLVKSQLQISRAIGNAAISIAAATTGIPIALDSVEGQPAPEAKRAQTSQEAEALAKRKVQAEQAAKLRARAVRNLRNNLASLREELRLLDSGKKLKEFPDLQSLFNSILRAHKPFFSDSSGNKEKQ
jgi:hypothetical protein